MRRGRQMSKVFRRGLGATLALIACLATMSVAWAMRVSPMVSELTTTGAGSTTRIEVGNVGSAVLPFETLITKVDFGPNGELIETPADENFLVFPPQGLVGVGGRQVVRVQWVGKPDLDVSEAYYLWVKQLPVATTPETTEGAGAVQVTVLYTMKSLIVVAPNGAQPNVSVVSVKPAQITPPMPEIDPALGGSPAIESLPSEPGLEITVSNSGKRYALMSGATWIITGTSKSGEAVNMQLGGQQVAEAVGVGYLAPGGGVRTFKLPLGIEFDETKPIGVRFAR